VQRKRLALLPRSLPSPGDEEEPKSPVKMSEAEATQKANADVNELIESSDLDKAERYLKDLPSEYHYKLVDKLVSTAIESSTGDATAFVTLVFERASAKRLCTAGALEEGLGAVAEFLEEIVLEFPLAYERYVTMAKCANLDSAALLRVWRKGHPSKLVALLR
jgi:translation initiation factor 4G